MEGLVKEGSELMEEGFENAVLDAELIGAARRVKHYGIAAYGVVSEIAKALGQTNPARFLAARALAEETETDEKLSDLAMEISSQAKEEGFEEQQANSSENERCLSTPLSQLPTQSFLKRKTNNHEEK